MSYKFYVVKLLLICEPAGPDSTCCEHYTGSTKQRFFKNVEVSAFINMEFQMNSSSLDFWSKSQAYFPYFGWLLVLPVTTGLLLHKYL
jgi:hypothetical protein